jgi:hypothetical protein
MAHKEMVANIAKELMLKLIELNSPILRLSARGGDEAIKELGDRFTSLLSMVDTSLKTIE